jgi:hypothetical protein
MVYVVPARCCVQVWVVNTLTDRLANLVDTCTRCVCMCVRHQIMARHPIQPGTKIMVKDEVWTVMGKVGEGSYSTLLCVHVCGHWGMSHQTVLLLLLFLFLFPFPCPFLFLFLFFFFFVILRFFFRLFFRGLSSQHIVTVLCWDALWVSWRAAPHPCRCRLSNSTWRPPTCSQISKVGIQPQ